MAHNITPVLPLSRLSGACADQMEIIRREWPNGIPLTHAAADRAVALEFDFDWAAYKLLQPPAWAEYRRVKASAWARYECVTAPALDAALAEYERVLALKTLAEYELVIAPVRAEYKRVTTPAWTEYQQVKAHCLVELLSMHRQTRQWRKQKNVRQRRDGVPCRLSDIGVTRARGRG